MLSKNTRPFLVSNLWNRFDTQNNFIEQLEKNYYFIRLTFRASTSEKPNTEKLLNWDDWTPYLSQEKWFVLNLSIGIKRNNRGGSAVTNTSLKTRMKKEWNKTNKPKNNGDNVGVSTYATSFSKWYPT